MRKNQAAPRGRVDSFTIDSQVLRGNLLGDPHERRVDLYIPHGHDGRGLPLLVDLVGFTAGGPAHTNWKNFGENVPERADRLIAEGKLPPVVIAFPDCFTRLGGNQYINSAAMGRWEDFLIDEMLPAVEARLRLRRAGPARRVRQELRRLRLDHPRHAPRRHLERRRVPFRRHGVRAGLSAGDAERAAGAGQARGLDRALRSPRWRRRRRSRMPTSTS